MVESSLDYLWVNGKEVLLWYVFEDGSLSDVAVCVVVLMRSQQYRAA